MLILLILKNLLKYWVYKILNGEFFKALWHFRSHIFLTGEKHAHLKKQLLPTGKAEFKGSMKIRKIWIVTELFYPEETAVAYIFTRIADYLSKDYDVSVICGPEFYDIHKKTFIDSFIFSNHIEIYRIKSLNLNKNSLIQRTIKLISISFKLGYLMCKKIPENGLVILSTNPAPLLLLVSVIKYFRKFRLHILVHDVFPENTIPAKIFKNSKSFIFRTLKFFFDKAYSRADHLIVIGCDMKEIISKKVSPFKKQPLISIVPNWSHSTITPIINDNQGRKKMIKLQYAGNIGRVEGLIEVVDAFRLSNGKDLILNLRGTGALTVYFQNYISKFKCNNIFFSGGYSRNEENEILADCDIGIVSLSAGMFGLGVPSKTYNLLSAGKPILYIGEPGTEISKLVLENEIGWSLDIGDQNSLIEFFGNLNCIDRDVLVEMGKKARSLAENEYNESKILRLFQSKIELIKN